jgi:hypothetical protein
MARTATTTRTAGQTALVLPGLGIDPDENGDQLDVFAAVAEAATATPQDHQAAQSVTFLCALEDATENWADYVGRPAETDAELAEVEAWALGYIADGTVEVYDGDDLDRIAGAAARVSA